MAKLQSFNPANGEVVGELEITTNQEIQEMVERSKVAQKKWAATPVEERTELILKAYELILARKEEIAQLIHQEMGKPLKESVGEVDGYSAGIKRMTQEVIEAVKPTENNDGRTKTTIYRDPLGVCASVTPWNFPMGMPHTLMMPSLMAGNTVLFKPSEEVFLTGAKYAEILNEVLPPDVLQLVIGTGEQGKALVEADVQLITFTGSVGTGRRILEAAAKDFKRVLLEMGGKDPLIVLEDADVEAAARFASGNSFRNSGQVCVSTEKILVMESIYEDFLAKLKEYSKDVSIGPMVHGGQKNIVMSQVNDAVESGAEVVFGDPKADEGNFISPTIMTGLNPDMKIMQDETFGPVACVIPVKSKEEAIQIANDGGWGLGAVVFGKDLEKANEVARQLSAGMVGINKACGGAKGSPWVGTGSSGYGFHGSIEGHRQFTQLRIVSHPVQKG
jgi:acyl-CoA reductase-like NAD-dependent aldehyde dehydrogenase